LLALKWFLGKNITAFLYQLNYLPVKVWTIWLNEKGLNPPVKRDGDFFPNQRLYSSRQILKKFQKDKEKNNERVSF
jgi:hypothetical protein